VTHFPLGGYARTGVDRPPAASRNIIRRQILRFTNVSCLKKDRRTVPTNGLRSTQKQIAQLNPGQKGAVVIKTRSLVPHGVGGR
jgi:hypothetical protein